MIRLGSPPRIRREFARSAVVLSSVVLFVMGASAAVTRTAAAAPLFAAQFRSFDTGSHPFPRLLSVALPVSAPVPCRADEDATRPPGALPPLYESVPGTHAGEDERESPPQRVTREQLEKLAAGAVAPQLFPFQSQGLGPAGLDWTFLGPRPMTGEYWSSNRDAGGRVSCVAPHPTDPGIAYAAAAQGGVWKTTDGGATWTVLTESLSSISSGWLAIDPLNFHPLRNDRTTAISPGWRCPRSVWRTWRASPAVMLSWSLYSAWAIPM